MGSFSRISIGAVLVAVLTGYCKLILPDKLRQRDDAYFVPPSYTTDELQALHACHGSYAVNHSSEILDRLTPTIKGQIRPVGHVNLHYITTICGDDHYPKKERHVLLLHGTGMTSKSYTKNEYPPGPSLFSLLQQAGYDVTAVDMRGHGMTEITDGPYSNELLAADIAALLREHLMVPGHDDGKDGNIPNKVHCHGHSAGFGVCMALAAFDRDLVRSLSGNGFFFDRSHRDILGLIFGNKWFNRFLGIAGLASLDTVDGPYSKQAKHCHLDGYIHLSQGWYQFNLTQHLSTWDVPTLVIHPEFDDMMGYTTQGIQAELDLIPSTTPTHIVEFANYSHMMIMEKGGARKTFDVIHSFMLEQQQKQSSHEQAQEQQQQGY